MDLDGFAKAYALRAVTDKLSALTETRKQPVLVAELLAGGDAVCELRRRTLSILSDSQDAVSMVARWKRGDT